jgi:hypothetical protein
VRAKGLLALAVVVVAGLGLAVGQTRSGLERSGDAGHLASLLRTQREWLLVGSAFPFPGADRVFADGLRSRAITLRVLTSSAEVSRWRDWMRLGATVRGHAGSAARSAILVSPGMTILPDPKRGDFIVLSDLETPKVIADRLELAWRYARP